LGTRTEPKVMESRTKTLVDAFGVIREAAKILPPELKPSFLECLAELEDNDAHKTRNFPKTRLHRLSEFEQAIYRADVDKISGWRLHVQYGKDKALHLKDIVPGDDHDRVGEVIKSKKGRYE